MNNLSKKKKKFSSNAARVEKPEVVEQKWAKNESVGSGEMK